jgi:hypothetical protein
MNGNRKLRAGEWVEVRSRKEILATLDQTARLDGMPFMPQMLNFCGKRFKVYKRAHKTCDTVFPVRGRRLADAVHLETRCDGEAYGGCQAGCLLFWKEAWLKRVDSGGSDRAGESESPASNRASASEDERVVWMNVYAAGSEKDADPSYVCQATQLPYATTDLPWWEISQYIEDYTSGNNSLWRLFKGLVYSAYYNLSNAGIGVGPAMRWAYDLLHPLWRGFPFPRRYGTIPSGQPTPPCSLNLQPGELVRVKSHAEILATLDTMAKNRGLYYDAEGVPYSGRTYRVLKRVTKIIDEKTGKLLVMKTPSLILDGVVCQARYSYCRMFCPRSIYSYWREIWLERVSEASAPTVDSGR